MANVRESLEQLLGSLGESSQFVASGAVPPVLPGLEVKGIGPIGCPVAAADVKRLIANANQAPYGRGEETIVDTKVRRVWQLSLDHWLDPQGRKQPFGSLQFAPNEILGLEDKGEWSCRKEVHEATGNEGVSVDLWYRQGVMVVWPRDRYFGILAGEGPASAVPALERMATRSRRPASVAECRVFAEEIIRHWTRQRRSLDGAASFPARMLRALERIGTPDLIERFLRDVLPQDHDGSEGKPLHRVFQQIGWEPFAAALQAFVARQKPDDYHARLEHIVSICQPLFCDPPKLTGERRAVCLLLADELAGVIERWDGKRAEAWYRREENRAGIVERVVQILASVSAKQRLDWFAGHVLEDKRHYDLHATLIPAVKAMHKWLAKWPAAQPAASRILQHCIAELRAATAQPIQPPKDWKRDAKLDCKCADCRMLSQFLRDPAQSVARFPLRKDRRQHLHQQIEKHGCDVTHVTERKGSPQTLVCTKTQASYQRRLKQFAVDQKLLAELERL